MIQKNAEVIQEKVSECKAWYHRIEVAPDVVTPGTHDSDRDLTDLDSLGLPKDASGLRVLDVGARDGFFSFEMERRGAEVVAVDYADPSQTGFSIASELLGSNVPYYVDNVYTLTPQKYGMFDVILFLGVIYHLRNPMLALDRLRTLANPHSLMFVESRIARAPLFRWWAPYWRFAPGDSESGDGTNCWIPTMSGLAAVVTEAEFEVIGYTNDSRRGYLVAQAVHDEKLAHLRNLDSSAGAWQF